MVFGKLHKDIFRYHIHSEALARTLRMPYNAAAPVAALVICVDCCDDFFKSKKLLIAANFLYICVIQNKILDNRSHSSWISHYVPGMVQNALMTRRITLIL